MFFGESSCISVDKAGTHIGSKWTVFLQDEVRVLVNLFIGHEDGDNTYVFLNNAFNIF